MGSRGRKFGESLGLLAGCLWVLAGCGDGKALMLGEQASALLNEPCATCTESEAVEVAEAVEVVEVPGVVTLPPGQAVDCVPGDGGVAELVFSDTVSDRLCNTAWCQVEIIEIVAGNDGSLWVLAAVRRAGEVVEDAELPGLLLPPYAGAESSSIWVARYSAAGELLGAREESSSLTWGMNLTIDGSGNAWVAYGSIEGDPVLQQFDGGLNPLGVSEAEGLGPTAYTGEGILMAAPFGLHGPHSWTAYDVDGEVQGRIVEPSTLKFPRRLVGDGRGAFGVGAQSGHRSGWVSLERRAPDGELLWQGLLSRPMPQADTLRLEVDPAGDVLVAGSLYGYSDEWIPEGATCAGRPCSGRNSVAYLHKLSAEGTPLWTLHFESNLNLAFAVSPSDGRIYSVSQHSNGYIFDGPGSANAKEISTSAGYLLEWSADAETCRKLSFAGVEMLNDLDVAPDGSLYFRGQDTVGRFVITDDAP